MVDLSALEMAISLFYTGLMSFIIVTGATSGIGRAYALLLANKGYDLVLCGQRSTQLEELAQTIRQKFGRQVDTQIGDLADPQFQNAVIAKGQSLPLGGLINNAGFGTSDLFVTDAFEKQYKMMEVHCHAPMKLCHALIPQLLGKKGFVINVASMAADLPVPRAAIYAASKAALLRFSEVLDLEHIQDDLMVQCLMPGFTKSDFHGRLDHFEQATKSKGLIRWLTADQVVQNSWKRLKKGRVRVITGLVNRLVLYPLRRLPWCLYRLIAGSQKI